LPREIAAREIRENSNSEFLEVIDDAQKARDIYIHLAESIDNEGLLLFANSMAGEVLNSVVEDINTGDLNSLITLYELMRVLRRNQDNMHKVQMVYAKVYVVYRLQRQTRSKGKRVQASDLALVITEWSFSGTGSDGNPVNMTA